MRWCSPNVDNLVSPVTKRWLTSNMSHKLPFSIAPPLSPRRHESTSSYEWIRWNAYKKWVQKYNLCAIWQPNCAIYMIKSSIGWLFSIQCPSDNLTIATVIAIWLWNRHGKVSLKWVMRRSNSKWRRALKFGFRNTHTHTPRLCNVWCFWVPIFQTRCHLNKMNSGRRRIEKKKRKISQSLRYRKRKCLLNISGRRFKNQIEYFRLHFMFLIMIIPIPVAHTQSHPNKCIRKTLLVSWWNYMLP